MCSTINWFQGLWFSKGAFNLANWRIFLKSISRKKSTFLKNCQQQSRFCQLKVDFNKFSNSGKHFGGEPHIGVSRYSSDLGGGGSKFYNCKMLIYSRLRYQNRRAVKIRRWNASLSEYWILFLAYSNFLPFTVSLLSDKHVAGVVPYRLWVHLWLILSFSYITEKIVEWRRNDHPRDV